MPLSHSKLRAAILHVLSVLTTAQSNDWHKGRASHYGWPGDGWSIHEGSCGYGYLDPKVATGWDIVALADANWGYSGSDSCGRCYEVKCDPMAFSDGYGEWLDRNGACYDASASIVVMVTDTCPCYYPSNAFSNKRWCCGDMQHFDMSVYSYEKLAAVKWGVIGIQFREVSCDYKPAKQAQISDGDKTHADRNPPWNWETSMDKRPWSNIFTSIPDTKYGSANTDDEHSSTDIFFGGLKPGWVEESYSTWRGDEGQHSPQSPDYTADCKMVQSGGGVLYKGWEGAFSGYHSIRFWVKQNDGQLPEFSFQLRGKKGFCRETRLSSIAWDYKEGDWVRFTMPLNMFDWRTPQSASENNFEGCSDVISASDIAILELKNTQNWVQQLCIDQVHLFQ